MRDAAQRLQALQARVEPLLHSSQLTLDQVTHLFSKISLAPALIETLVDTPDETELHRLIVSLMQTCQVILVTGDESALPVPASTVDHSAALQARLRGCDEHELPLVVPISVNADAVRLAFEYCEKPSAWSAASAWRGVSSRTLCDVAISAFQLGIEPLVELATREMASLINDKTPEQVHELIAGSVTAPAAVPEPVDFASAASGDSAPRQLPSLTPEQAGTSVSRADVFRRMAEDRSQTRTVQALASLLAAERSSDVDAAQAASRAERRRQMRRAAEANVRARVPTRAQRRELIQTMLSDVTESMPSTATGMIGRLGVDDERVVDAMLQLPSRVWTLDAYQRASFPESREQQEQTVAMLTSALTDLTTALGARGAIAFLEQRVAATPEDDLSARVRSPAPSSVQTERRAQTMRVLLSALRAGMRDACEGLECVYQSQLPPAHECASWRERNPITMMPHEHVTETGPWTEHVAEALFGSIRRVSDLAERSSLSRRKVPVPLSGHRVISWTSLEHVLEILARMHPDLPLDPMLHVDLDQPASDHFGFPILSPDTSQVPVTRFLNQRMAREREHARVAASEAVVLLRSQVALSPSDASAWLKHPIEQADAAESHESFIKRLAT